MKQIELMKLLGVKDIDAIRRVKAEFDVVFYFKTNPDVEQADLDPFEHYVRYGVAEGRDPTPSFDTIFYSALYSDRINGMNPFAHYVINGRSEGLQCTRRGNKSQIALTHDDAKIIAQHFDAAFYLERYPDVKQSGQNPILHYCTIGWKEGRDPSPVFNTRDYLKGKPTLAIQGRNPFVHYLSHRLTAGDGSEKQGNSTSDEAMLAYIYETIKLSFDRDFYAAQTGDHTGNVDPVWHYIDSGVELALDPSSDFSTSYYLKANPDVAEADVNPFFHYLAQGKSEGRTGLPDYNAVELPTADDNNSSLIKGEQAIYHDMHIYSVVAEHFDYDFYAANYLDAVEYEDLVVHYLIEGVLRDYDPTPLFSTSYYIKNHPDVKDAGVNPFFHYISQGKNEGRRNRKSRLAPVDHLSEPISSIAREHSKFTSPSDAYEELNIELCKRYMPKTKALAFYLPQFYAFPENDAWWGTGFTEWRNVTRGLPRYVGHYQPRIPRDLGFYDLSDTHVIKKQVELARAGGLYGFCFYYYSFNGKRLLDKPVESFLKNSDIDFPFLLIWANENWTKTWDGFEKSVLMSQDYRDEDEDDLLADFARHFFDSRYIKIDRRPVLVIYRPNLIPDAKERFARWRRKWIDKHEINPLIFMAQGFDEYDPYIYGLDGAMEFPPHKVASGLIPVNNKLDILDDEFSGNVLSYDEMIQRSCSELNEKFPLIKGVTLNWDNEARRPGRGMSFHGVTPDTYEAWLRRVVSFSRENLVFGESFVVINAWNEWAEGTYLEPDVHYGAAFLNATARAVFGAPVSQRGQKQKILLIGHDAYRHGAQILILNIGKILSQQFGIEVRYIILGGGPMLDDYQAVGSCVSINIEDSDAIDAAVSDARKAGFCRAIVNTTVAGISAISLHANGITFISLIHELPNLIKEYRLESACVDISRYAAHIVFPAQVVQDGFFQFVEKSQAVPHIKAQGLYNSRICPAVQTRCDARKRLGISNEKKIVINVGFADSRKGFDIFLRVAQSMIINDNNIIFIWVGAATEDINNWVLPEIKSGVLADKFIITGHVGNVEDYYASADVFFISSREDPFPSVVMEAMAAGLPIVGFEASGGCIDLYREFGALVARDNLPAIVSAIDGFINAVDSVDAESAAKRRIEAVKQYFQFDSYCFALVQLLDNSLKRVSVAVPNYNYAGCIIDRLDSIRVQNYPIFELIVLDDRSTDNSVDIIREWSSKRGVELRLVVNEYNSGNVFKQWERAIAESRGELVWIAEADDLASPDFLEKLTAAFDDTTVGVSFSDSWQLNADGETIGASYKDYLREEGVQCFDNSFIMSGDDFLKDCLSIKNSILNVSSVVWLKSAFVAGFDELNGKIFDCKVAGDWLLYAAVAAVGYSFSYESKPLNGHRRHSSSVTHALAAKRHFSEISLVQNYVEERVDLSLHIYAIRKAYTEKVANYLGIYSNDVLE